MLDSVSAYCYMLESNLLLLQQVNIALALFCPKSWLLINKKMFVVNGFLVIIPVFTILITLLLLVDDMVYLKMVTSLCLTFEWQNLLKREYMLLNYFGAIVMMMSQTEKQVY